jgi:hypothetical protein
MEVPGSSFYAAPPDSAYPAAGRLRRSQLQRMPCFGLLLHFTLASALSVRPLASVTLSRTVYVPAELKVKVTSVPVAEWPAAVLQSLRTMAALPAVLVLANEQLDELSQL